ncbi:MAG: Crp/Fnr family transcriptional regulator [Ramlibacter sp.]
MTADAGALQNRLIAALPEEVRRRWLVHLEPEDLQVGKVLYESGKHLSHAHFPTTAIVSLLHGMQDGASSEIAMLGNDGMLGLSLVMGRGSTSTRGVVQSGGQAYRLPAALLRTEFERGGATRELLLLYAQALFSQVTQIAACNRHHNIEQQLCRWLLLSLDRLDSDELVMTQEHISNMLGVRREGVTAAAARLQRRGAIHYSRGRIMISDRKLLEHCACECYGAVREEYERLLPESGHRGPWQLYRS